MSYNKAYHSYFEGYTEKEEFDPVHQKFYIKRTYASCYYRHNMTDQEWKALKVRYVLFLAAYIAALFIQGVSAGTGVWYMAIPTALELIDAMWLTFYVVCYVRAPRLLKIRQYRDREHLKMAAMAGVLCLVWLFIGQLVFMILNGFYRYGLISMAVDAGAAVCLRLLYVTERDMDFRKVKNEADIDPDSYDIRKKSDADEDA